MKLIDTELKSMIESAGATTVRAKEFECSISKNIVIGRKSDPDLDVYDAIKVYSSEDDLDDDVAEQIVTMIQDMQQYESKDHNLPEEFMRPILHNNIALAFDYIINAGAPNE